MSHPVPSQARSTLAVTFQGNLLSASPIVNPAIVNSPGTAALPAGQGAGTLSTRCVTYEVSMGTWSLNWAQITTW